jgi:predicted acyl esterase
MHSPLTPRATAAVLLGLAPLSSPLLAQPYTMRVDHNTRVPMRDGVTLSADVYRPDAPGRFPVILTRTPYNKAAAVRALLEKNRALVARGYVMVAMDVRGRGTAPSPPSVRKVPTASIASSGAPPSRGPAARSQ